jgi:hypothetical protein
VSVSVCVCVCALIDYNKVCASAQRMMCKCNIEVCVRECVLLYTYKVSVCKCTAYGVNVCVCFF